MKRKIDLTSVLGLVLAFAGIGVGYILEGGSLVALLAVSPILIIFGGTIGVTIAITHMSTVKDIPKLVKIVFTDVDYDHIKLIDDICEWAKVSRKEGIVALGNITNDIEDPYLKKGMEYILDGSDYETIKEMLEKEIEAMMERHHSGAKPFEQAGGYGPSMGIVGTVLGLVVILGNLATADIGELGHGISAAFLATFMGVASANLVFLPFAEKLKVKSGREVLYKEIALNGILGIQTGTNPKILKKKLVAFLPYSIVAKAENKGNGAE